MVKIRNTSLAQFALSCKYISEPIYELISLSLEIGKLINYMILNQKKVESKRVISVQ
jgi:hypothetical protein